MNYQALHKCFIWGWLEERDTNDAQVAQESTRSFQMCMKKHMTGKKQNLAEPPCSGHYIITLTIRRIAQVPGEPSLKYRQYHWLKFSPHRTTAFRSRRWHPWSNWTG